MIHKIFNPILIIYFDENFIFIFVDTMQEDISNIDIDNNCLIPKPGS